MVIGPSFLLTGFEPASVRSAPLDDRREFWLAVSGFVVEAKADELAAGLDKDGTPFIGLSPKTIKHRKSAMGPADPGAPALQPAHGLSRTRSLFSAEPTPGASGVVCYWAFDSVTGDSWGEILDYHRSGSGALPVRDVFGLSPDSLGTVKRRGEDWWRGYIAAGPPLSGPGPAPIPTGIPPDWKPKGSGWGKRIGGKIVRIKDHGHVYDIQGGLGLGAPPGPGPPPVWRNKTPKPKALPTITDIRKRVKPPPQPVPTPEPVPVPVITLQMFARSALAAARAVPDATKYSESKVWIIDVFDSYAARGGLLGLDAFKAQLLESHRAGLLALGRFDLPGQLSKADRIKDAESAIFAGVAEFNFMRI